MNKPRLAKITLAIVAGLLTITVVALVVLLHFDWNRAKPWINTRGSEVLGRPFAIAGNLTLVWEKPAAGQTGMDEGWRNNIPWPHLVAQEIHIGNPPGIKAPASADMASIKQVDFSVSPLALLENKIVIPALHFDSPAVSLLRDAAGKDNWTFRNDDKPLPWQLELQRVILSKGSIRLIDAIKHADLTADLDTLNTAPSYTDPRYGMAWQLRGKFNGEAVSGYGKAGTVLTLKHQATPYPIMANLHVGKTVIAVEGTLTKPMSLTALDMRLKVSGVSMARLYAINGIVLPETPPFVTEGHLVGKLKPFGSRWVYEKFSGKVGASDIGGDLEYQSKKPRAMLSGTVVSHLLHFSDLAPLVGADSNASKAKRGAAIAQPKNKMLPVEPFKTERWTSVDADIKFSAEKIILQNKFPINQLTTNLHLQDGVLSLLPLNFGMAGGSLNSNITLDGSGKSGKNAIKATVKVTARHLKLKQLFSTLHPLQTSAGEINGDATLSAVGNSVASLLGASNGEIKALINQGTVSQLVLEEMGLNIGSVIRIRLVGDKQIKLNCMATTFGVTNGLMQTHSFIIDTDDAILDISGNINLAQEQQDLKIITYSKGLRVLSLRAPLYVRGSFKQPSVSIDRGILAMRAGGAIALTVLAPVAAVLPLINAGQGKSSECAKLLADVRVKPLAPAPGKTYHGKVGAFFDHQKLRQSR